MGPAAARAGTAIVLYGRDLRVHDNPALSLACGRFEAVLPVFVLDDRLWRSSGARRLPLVDALGGLRAELRRRGGDLVVRRGDPVAEVVRLGRAHGVTAVLAAADVSGHAQRRQARLAAACGEGRMGLELVDSLGVVPSGGVLPASGDHYQRFTPYWRAWSAASWRAVLAAPSSIRLPEGVEPGELPVPPQGPAAPGAAWRAVGGEAAARRRMRAWLAGGLAAYARDRDDLALGATSRLSTDLHLGCLSALELATRARDAGSAGGPGGADGGEAFVRQLCWRDFFAQVLAARPEAATCDYRPRRQPWRDDQAGLEAWREGRTGVPIVDAGMRQLLVEGFMHNRARLVVASFLTRQLGVHWSEGAAHFARLLVDADVASNALNWQWAAGTGNSPRPNQVLDPLRQARHLDPRGDYVRRFVPELAHLAGPAVHEPWRSTAVARYPAPVVAVGGARPVTP